MNESNPDQIVNLDKVHEVALAGVVDRNEAALLRAASLVIESAPEGKARTYIEDLHEQRKQDLFRDVVLRHNNGALTEDEAYEQSRAILDESMDIEDRPYALHITLLARQNVHSSASNNENSLSLRRLSWQADKRAEQREEIAEAKADNS